MNFEWNMSLQWVYYIILAVCGLVIVLRLMNFISTSKFKKTYPNSQKVLTIKHDFFTTVTTCCILVTAFINGAAILTSHDMNYDSILITILMILVTMLNSIYTIYFVPKGNNLSYLGYSISSEEIEDIQIKRSIFGTTLTMNLTKDVDSYSYVKMSLIGSKKQLLNDTLESFGKSQETN